MAFYSGRFVGIRLFTLFDGIIFVISILATLYAAASWAFLNYIDGILKDISGIKEYTDEKKYLETIYKFGILKAEIVNNFILILILFICERLANGAFSIFYDPSVNSYQLIPNIAFSVRFACLSVVIFAFFCHLNGFVVALEYRNCIARYTRK